MALFELGGKKFTIQVGEASLGSDPACGITIAGPGVLPRHAVLQGQSDGQVIIRKATPAAEILINGVRLGAEPTPLLHGDKVDIGGSELTFVDERRSGSTQFMKSFAPATGTGPGAGPARPGGQGAVGTTGGRVVSLTDGREYVIAGASLVFGREAGCDVVVPGKDVSRRHAEIVQTPKGYLLVDSSTNGTFVNEERVEGQRILARADVIRLGDEQFRFYADAPGVAAAPPSEGAAASPPQAAPPPSPVSGEPGPPPGAAERLRHTLHGIESVAPPHQPPSIPKPAGAPSGALASFLVRNGVLAGQRLSLRTPVVNIGRADYNDLVLPDVSVSTTHGKLQRREGIWVLVDLDSTNGTFVDGERIKGEAPLAPGAMVRFGDVQLVFEPTDEAHGVTIGGGTQVLKTPLSVTPTAPPASPAQPVRTSPPPQPPPRPPGRPAPSPGGAGAPRGKPAPARPGVKPGTKRPVAQQPPPKKGKGCGSSAVILVLAGGAAVAVIRRLLA